jgi:hypothetical protein
MYCDNLNIPVLILPNQRQLNFCIYVAEPEQRH